MLEGEYEFQVEDQTFRAVQGTFVVEPRGILHTLKCVGTNPGAFVTSPASTSPRRSRLMGCTTIESAEIGSLISRTLK